jgi:AcrR family transcriptional regulator
VAPQRRTQAERRQKTEQALLDAAARLFAERGIDNTSLADIGAAAGLSRGLVNHRFGTKAALVERLAELGQDAFVQTMERSPSSDEADALLAVVDGYLDRFTDVATASRVFFVMWGAAFPEDSPLRPVFVADDARFRDGVETLVMAGQKHACVDSSVDAKGFAVAFVGLLRGIAAQMVVDPDGVDLAAARSTAKKFVQTAVNPKRRTGRLPRTRQETQRDE